MRFRPAAPLTVVSFLCLAACSSSSSSSSAPPPGEDAAAAADAANAGDTGAGNGDASPPSDGAASDGAAADAGDKAAGCVGTFGTAIGSVGFARFDGTVVAVLAPGNRTCTAPNSTHLVLEMSFSGAVYRMVVDVNDTVSPGTIRAHSLQHAMVGGPWSDGWHAAPLDYPGTFGLHDRDFTAESTADAVAAFTAAVEIGAHVSVFATAQGEVDSAHLVHRNLVNQDGALVVDVDGASPTWLLLAFSNQVF